MHFEYFSYIQFSNIAAKMVRRSLKKEYQVDATKRDDSSVKFTPWKDGKPISKYLLIGEEILIVS